VSTTLPRTVPASHLPGVTNPRVSLCQDDFAATTPIPCTECEEITHA
jgi:hypothetical protein